VACQAAAQVEACYFTSLIAVFPRYFAPFDLASFPPISQNKKVSLL